MKRFIGMLLLSLPFFTKVQAQQNRPDSLYAALQHAANDTMRMDLMRQLGYYYFNLNPDSMVFYFDQSASIARKLKLKLYEAGLLSSEAYHFSWSNYPRALELSQQALAIAEDPASEKDVWGLAVDHTPHTERLSALGYIYFNMAQLYANTGNIEKQVTSLVQSINIAQSLGDSVLNMLANLNLGNVYLDQIKKLDSAHYYEQRALNLFSKSTGDAGSIGWVYGSIGAIYFEQKKFDLSEAAFQTGLQSMQDQNNLAGIGSLCLSLSNLYKTVNKPDSSLLYAYKALETYQKFKDRKGIADAYASLSSAYDVQKRTDSALAYLKLSTALSDSLAKVAKDNLVVFQNKNFDEQMRVKNLENEKIQTRGKIRMYAMLAGIAVFMVIAFLLFRNNLHRKKANLLLQKQKEEIAVQKEHTEQALSDLKAAQSQLIQSEKMASLGELTAGIAHEIQNPLNFVNNFSEVNQELTDELKAGLAVGNLQQAMEIANDIKANSEKINHHGKRADAIVKSMLQHSRTSTSVKEPTDINKLVLEYMNLAYHGLRAKDNSFNVTLKTDMDASIENIPIIPQDIGRVLLNLFTNAFYTVYERKKAEGIDYVPVISVTTKKTANQVLINVSDNGNGIPPKIVDKIFQPFFTTKPAGQGTGLGLSLSYDIIKAHSGDIKVTTKENEGTEFIIELPITK